MTLGSFFGMLSDAIYVSGVGFAVVGITQMFPGRRTGSCELGGNFDVGLGRTGWGGVMPGNFSRGLHGIRDTLT